VKDTFLTQELLQKRIAEIEQRIQAACERSGRKREDVKIIAVTKYVDADAVGELLHAGIEHIGENRVQDGVPKYEAHGTRGTWHFIGHLQTNKVKDVVGRFHYIHSLDRMSLAREIEKKAAALDIVVRCFVEINISGEETKHGCSPNDVLAFVQEISNMKHIQIVGLMTMAPLEASDEEIRSVFRELRVWKERLEGLSLPYVSSLELSMGMSGDFELAIEEGATFIRLGTVLVKP